MEHKHQNSTEGAMVYINIDRYEDIFSDFDARPFSERTLSTDFTDEIRRQLYARNESILGINFKLPETIRNKKIEEEIQSRLISHFRKHVHQTQQARRYIIKRSIFMVLAGVIGMITTSYITTFEQVHRFPFSLFRVLLEPAAWFLLWEGANQYFSRMEEIRPDIELYAKISKEHADIHFSAK